MLTTTEEHFKPLERALRNNSIPDVKQILQTVHVAATESKSGWTCVTYGCCYSKSAEVIKLVFEKIVEVGGSHLLKSQLSRTGGDGQTCFAKGCWNSLFPEIMKLIAVILFKLDLLKEEYAKLDDYDMKTLRRKAGIESSSWTPDAECLAEVEILLERGNFIYAIHSNDHVRMKEFLKNNDFGRVKKILESNLNMIMQACSEPKTRTDTVKLLFSEIKCIGGDNYFKIFLEMENGASGETWLLSVCLRDPMKLELILETMEEVGGGTLVDQISNKRRSDRMTPLYALCKFAPNFDSLSLLVSKIFRSDFLSRPVLTDQLDQDPCLECLFSRPLDSPGEKKLLYGIVNLYSITGLFEATYSRFDEEKRGKIRRICKIESGEWSRTTSNKLAESTSFGDVIGEIKETVFEYDKQKKKEKKI